MIDREKVITGLEHCITDEPCCRQKYITCPYTPRKTGDDNCARALAKDVLALLKEQEAVEPIPPTEESGLWRCGKCHRRLFCVDDKDLFCSKCGQAVKWE